MFKVVIMVYTNFLINAKYTFAINILQPLYTFPIYIEILPIVKFHNVLYIAHVVCASRIQYMVTVNRWY